MPEVIIRLLVFFVHPQGLLVDRQAAFYDKEKAYPTTFFSMMYDLNPVDNFLSESSPTESKKISHCRSCKCNYEHTSEKVIP